jgi:hypothetical protein
VPLFFEPQPAIAKTAAAQRATAQADRCTLRTRRG